MRTLPKKPSAVASFLLAISACTAPGALAQGGFYFGAVYSGISDPTFRFPSGFGELSVPQSKSTPGFLTGYHHDWNAVGLGARVLYWHAAFKNFDAPEMPGSGGTTSVKYTDPALRHVSSDLIAQWNPLQGFRGLGIYGLLGLASSTKSYTISGSSFPEWNGGQSRTQFDYSYGLGARVSPLRPISLLAELRWIPGDSSMEAGDFLYSDGIYDYYTVKSQSTAHHTKIWSLGMSVNIWR